MTIQAETSKYEELSARLARGQQLIEEARASGKNVDKLVAHWEKLNQERNAAACPQNVDTGVDKVVTLAMYQERLTELKAKQQSLMAKLEKGMKLSALAVKMGAPSEIKRLDSKWQASFLAYGDCSREIISCVSSIKALGGSSLDISLTAPDPSPSRPKAERVVAGGDELLAATWAGFGPGTNIFACKR